MRCQDIFALIHKVLFISLHWYRITEEKYYVKLKNPVKNGLVERVVDWPYSSFHGYVNQGNYLTDWGDNDLKFSVNFIYRLE